MKGEAQPLDKFRQIKNGISPTFGNLFVP